MRVLAGVRDALLSPVAVILATLVLGYGLYERNALGSAAPADGAEHVLSVLSAPPLLAMVLLPAWFGVVLIGVAGVSDTPERLLRHGSRVRALRAAFVTELRFLIAGSVVVTVAVMATAAGLPLGSGWSIAPLGGPTVVVLLLAVLVPALSFAVLGIVVVVIRLLSGRGWLAAVAAVVLWVWAASGTLGAFASSPLLDLGSYLSLSAMLVDDLIAWRMLAVLVVALLAGLAARARDQQRFARTLSRVGASGLAVAMLLAYATLILVTAREARDSAAAAAVALLAGSSGTVLATGFTLLTLFGFTGAFSAWFGERLGGFGLFELVRMGTPARWLRRMLGRAVVWAAAYTGLVVGGIAVIYLLLGGAVGDAREDAVVVLFLLLLTTLQLVFLSVVMAGVVLLAGSQTAVVIVLAVLIALNLIPIPGPVTPFALSLVDVPPDLDVVARRSATLLVWIAVCAIALAVAPRIRGVRTLISRRTRA